MQRMNKKYLVEKRHEDLFRPVDQWLYKFPNGYGASVARGICFGRPELYEVAVIVWFGDDFNLCYSTPITNNVIGYQDIDQVRDILYRIKNLEGWK